jgi:myb proto-oncogene protein
VWCNFANHFKLDTKKLCVPDQISACRWYNHLNPGINKDAWTQEEEIRLIQAHQVYGNKWAELSKYLPGR